MKNFIPLLIVSALVLHHASHANTSAGALHNDPNLCAYGYNPNCQPQYQHPPADFSTPPLLANASNYAIAFSPQTGAVGVSAFAYKQSQTHWQLSSGHEDYALASCISKVLDKDLGRQVSLSKAQSFVRRHGRKTDCKVVHKNDNLKDNFVAIMRGKALSDGLYQLFWVARPSNNMFPFRDEDTDIQALIRNCQAVATDCVRIGAFGHTTEMY